MNKFSFRKISVLSFAFVMSGLSLFAQEEPKDSENKEKVEEEAASTPKLFGGSKQYRTWSGGIYAGGSMPSVWLGGSNDFNVHDFNMAYGLYFQKQLTHSFALKFDFSQTKLSGSNDNKSTSGATQAEFETKVSSAMSIQAQVDLTALFLQKESKFSAFVQGGAGIVSYTPTGSEKGSSTYFPVGGGAKYRVSDRVTVELLYLMHFVDSDELDGYSFGPSNDKYGNITAGLNYSFGPKNKQNLDWVNPIAVMYDELSEPELKAEVEALKTRVTASEAQVEEFKKDTDGDGVSDVFDKDNSTPQGAQVDGAGREIMGNVQKTGVPAQVVTAKGDFLFNKDSATMRNSSASIINDLANQLKMTNGSVLLEGHTSDEEAGDKMQLSEERANAVKSALIDAGVPAENISVKGYADANPIASNDVEEGREKNRRVEIKLQ